MTVHPVRYVDNSAAARAARSTFARRNDSAVADIFDTARSAKRVRSLQTNTQRVRERTQAASPVASVGQAVVSVVGAASTGGAVAAAVAGAAYALVVELSKENATAAGTGAGGSSAGGASSSSGGQQSASAVVVDDGSLAVGRPGGAPATDAASRAPPPKAPASTDDANAAHTSATGAIEDAAHVRAAQGVDDVVTAITAVVKYAETVTTVFTWQTVQFHDLLVIPVIEDTPVVAVVPDPPPVNVAPVIASASFVFDENTTAGQTLDVIDGDGDALTFSLSGPDAALFSVMGGVFSFIAAQNYEQHLSYAVTLTVDDGQGHVVATSLTVSVANVSEPITSAAIQDFGGAFEGSLGSAAVQFFFTTEDENVTYTYTITSVNYGTISTTILDPATNLVLLDQVFNYDASGSTGSEQLHIVAHGSNGQDYPADYFYPIADRPPEFTGPTEIHLVSGQGLDLALADALSGFTEPDGASMSFVFLENANNGQDMAGAFIGGYDSAGFSIVGDHLVHSAFYSNDPAIQALSGWEPGGDVFLGFLSVEATNINGTAMQSFVALWLDA